MDIRVQPGPVWLSGGHQAIHLLCSAGGLSSSHLSFRGQRPWHSLLAERYTVSMITPSKTSRYQSPQVNCWSCICIIDTDMGTTPFAMWKHPFKSINITDHVSWHCYYGDRSVVGKLERCYWFPSCLSSSLLTMRVSPLNSLSIHTPNVVLGTVNLASTMISRTTRESRKTLLIWVHDDTFSMTTEIFIFL